MTLGQCEHSFSLTVPIDLTLRPAFRFLQIGLWCLCPAVIEFWPTRHLLWTVRCNFRLIRLLFRNMCVFLMIAASAFVDVKACCNATGAWRSTPGFSLFIVGPCWGPPLGGSGHAFGIGQFPGIVCERCQGKKINRVSKLLRCIGFKLNLLWGSFYDDFPFLSQRCLADTTLECAISLLKLLGFAFSEHRLKPFAERATVVEVDLAGATDDVKVRNKPGRVEEIDLDRFWKRVLQPQASAVKNHRQVAI